MLYCDPPCFFCVVEALSLSSSSRLIFMFPALLHSELLFLLLAKLGSCLTDHPFASIFLHGDKDPEPMERLHKHEGENERVLDEVERVGVALESSEC